MADDEAYSEGQSLAPSAGTVPANALAADPLATLRATDPLRAAVSLALGAAGFGVAAVWALLVPPTVKDGRATDDERAEALRGPIKTMEGFAVAAAGLGVEAQRRCINAAETVGSPILSTASAVVMATMAKGPAGAVGRRLGRWSDVGRAEQRCNQEIRALVAAVFAEADVDALVARVDMDRIIDRLHLNEIIKRVDLDVIAGRLDLDAVASRLDVNAVVLRVDLARVTEQVLYEVDVGHIVRESSGAMAAETVDAAPAARAGRSGPQPIRRPRPVAPEWPRHRSILRPPPSRRHGHDVD